MDYGPLKEKKYCVTFLLIIVFVEKKKISIKYSKLSQNVTDQLASNIYVDVTNISALDDSFNFMPTCSFYRKVEIWNELLYVLEVASF